MVLIYLTFFCIVLPDVAFARSTEITQTEALWAKLNAYQNTTGISTEKKISIWERSQEFLQESNVKGKPILLNQKCPNPKKRRNFQSKKYLLSLKIVGFLNSDMECRDQCQKEL